MGGAHAVAALAYGTETIRRVDKIVGPGNAWVTRGQEAGGRRRGDRRPRRPQRGGDRGRRDRDPALRRRRPAAQAEHDPLAAAVLITPGRQARQAGRARGRAASSQALPTAETARALADGFGAALVGRSMDEAALGSSTGIAPEHLQLIGPAAEALAERVAQRRRDLRGRLDARGLRRLRRRPEPRAPHLRQRALRLGAGGRGLPAPQPPHPLHPRGRRLAGPPRRRPWPMPRGCRPMPPRRGGDCG